MVLINGFGKVGEVEHGLLGPHVQLAEMVDIREQMALVFLDRQDLVALLLGDLLRDLRLAAHGIHGDAASDFQQRQQSRDRCNLLTVIIHFLLRQEQAVITRPGADHVNRAPSLRLIHRAAQFFAIDGNDLSLGDLMDCFHPGHKTGLKGIGFQPAEHAPKGVMRWNAIA